MPRGGGYRSFAVGTYPQRKGSYSTPFYKFPVFSPYFPCSTGHFSCATFRILRQFHKRNWLKRIRKFRGKYCNILYLRIQGFYYLSKQKCFGKITQFPLFSLCSEDPAKSKYPPPPVVEQHTDWSKLLTATRAGRDLIVI